MAKKSNKIAKLDSAAIETKDETKIEDENKAETKPAKETPDGYVNFVARDEQTGTVFVTRQAATWDYVSALVCESPLGLIVARWSKDHKGLLREAKRIMAGKGTAGLANPRVVSVLSSLVAPEGAIARQRVREADYYALMGLVGPNHEKREAARLARAARAAEFAAAQAANAVSGPVEQA